MSTNISSSNDRTRTYWTPTMERYFIDLMLEQMHRGNRMGHTFNKQAWTDMLTLFNAEFGSQYDKDVLKSRYTNLWKQYNDIKNLLSQFGFSWDETLQMVVADEHVWNEYIQAHPDVRSYKTKAVLNFNDLCLIYGYTAADGRYSLSSHDLDFEDEFQNVYTGDGISIITLLSTDRRKTDWTAAMDQFFIELMLDQIGRGNKGENTFNKQAWTDMLALFNEKFGSQHGKRVLRHRYKKLWKYYNDMTITLKQNGFVWDEAQQMIVADDAVWDAYIKAHPPAKAYKLKTLPNYNDLVLIYGSTADGIMSLLVEDGDLEDDISAIKAGESKGIETSSADRVRTYWTPPMDRYLIDLLVDQVHRGNKLGQTFITQAWVNMGTSFSAKFGSHHDKDILKNRYRHLRRQYNDVKLLLEQDGFSWDATRDMVTAEDKVWDVYLKAHPDARSYRVKTVPSYQKLCCIFAKNISDRRYIRLDQSLDYSGETAVPVIGGENNGYAGVSIDPVSIDWTPTMDRYLIELMLEQLHRDNKIGQTFTEQAWTEMAKSFNEKFKTQSNIYTLENRYMYMMKEHDEISNILNHDRMLVWGESGEVIADGSVFEAYIQEHPQAILYRDKDLGNYNDLCKIIGNVSDVRFSMGDFDMETDQNILDIDMDVGSGDSQSLSGTNQISEPKRKPQNVLPSESEHVSKMAKTGEEMQEALSEMAGTKNSGVVGVVDALQAIPDIDDELLLDACDLLEEEKKAKIFLALDVNLRKKWLLRKLRPG